MLAINHANVIKLHLSGTIYHKKCYLSYWFESRTYVHLPQKPWRVVAISHTWIVNSLALSRIYIGIWVYTIVSIYDNSDTAMSRKLQVRRLRRLCNSNAKYVCTAKPKPMQCWKQPQDFVSRCNYAHMQVPYYYRTCPTC